MGLLRILLTAALAFAQAAPKPDDLPAPKKITLNLSATPLKAVAERLAKDSGYAIGLGDCDPKTKVSIKVDKVPFVLALDALCRSANAAYRWAGGGIELINESRMPAASASAQLGPFTMRAWVGPWDKETPALWVDTDWEPGAGAGWYLIRVDSILSENGEAWQRSRTSSTTSFHGEHTNNMKILAMTRGDGDWKRDYYPLLPPKGRPKKLKSVTGSLKVAFPVGPKKTVRFAPPADRMRETVDGFPFTLHFFEYDAARKTWDGTVSLQIDGAPQEKRLPLYGLLAGHRVRFYAKGGAPIPNTALGGAGYSGPEGDLRTVSIEGTCKAPDNTPLSAVEADFYGDVLLKDYPFEIKNVPVVATKE
jgi:hypothetical protein